MSGLKPTEWWPSSTYNHLEPTPFKDQEPIGDSQRPLQKELRCLHFPGQVCKDTYSKMVSDYGVQCYTRECSQGSVEYGSRIAFDPCDLSQDPKTGMRSRPCGKNHQPMVVVRCSKCANYSQAKEREREQREQWCTGAKLDMIVCTDCALTCRDRTTGSLHPYTAFTGFTCEHPNYGMALVSSANATVRLADRKLKVISDR